MDGKGVSDVNNLPGDSGSDSGSGPDQVVTLTQNWETHVPRFVFVFATALITALVIIAGLAVWWRSYQRAEDARNAAVDERIVLRDCESRAESGRQIKATAMAGVEHAEDTVALMVSIKGVLGGVNPDSPTIQAISAEIDRYTQNVVDFRAVAEKYNPPTVEECVLRSKTTPDGEG